MRTLISSIADGRFAFRCGRSSACTATDTTGVSRARLEAGIVVWSSIARLFGFTVGAATAGVISTGTGRAGTGTSGKIRARRRRRSSSSASSWLVLGRTRSSCTISQHDPQHTCVKNAARDSSDRRIQHDRCTRHPRGQMDRASRGTAMALRHSEHSCERRGLATVSMTADFQRTMA